MGLQRKSSLIALILLFVYTLIACGALNYPLQKMLIKCNPTSEKFLRAFFTADNSSIRNDFELLPDLTDAHLKSISEIMGKENFQSVKTLSCLSSLHRLTNNFYSASFRVDFTGGESFFSEVVFQADSLESRTPKLLGIHNFQWQKVFEKYEGWTSDAVANGLLGLGIVFGLLSFAVGVLAIYDHRKGWVWWLLLSQIGVGIVNIDLQMGGVFWRVINIGFPLFSLSKPVLAPWTASFMLPLFALIYLVRRSRSKPIPQP
jgi:hypothetical protein